MKKSGLNCCLKYIWARPWENVSYAIYEQQRSRSACASAQSDQRLCCSLPRQNDASSLYIRNFKILAGLCSWAGQFVSCLDGDSWRYIFSWRGSSCTVCDIQERNRNVMEQLKVNKQLFTADVIIPWRQFSSVVVCYHCYCVSVFLFVCTGPDSSVGRVSAPGNGRSRVRSRAATYQSRKKWY